MSGKPALAIYWASSCGGCEIAVANIHEGLLDLDAAFSLVFCPCLVDTKTRDLHAMPDGSIDVTLVNGAIRTDENLEMARLLRRKSRILMAYGSCASFGGIPALANLHPAGDTFSAVYLDAPGIDNPGRVLPQESTRVPEGVLSLPRFHDRVRTLAAAVEVDYFIPGCPPESARVMELVTLLASGAPLPPKGSVLGAGNRSACDECGRTRKEKVLPRLRRVLHYAPDPSTCLLEQGVLCMGPATRSGCGALCPQANMPCGGCYGPPDGVIDQEAKMASLLGSVLDIEPLKGLPREAIVRKVDALLDGIPDFPGALGKFTMGSTTPAAKDGGN